MKKIKFDTKYGQLLSILKCDASRFVEYTRNGRPRYRVGEMLQVDPEQVSRLIANEGIRHSIPFRACFMNNYNDIFSFPTDTVFVLQITAIHQLRASEFSLIDTLRLGVKSSDLNGIRALTIPDFGTYTCHTHSSQICALNAYLQQVCPLLEEIRTSNPVYTLYEFTTLIDPILEDEEDEEVIC